MIPTDEDWIKHAFALAELAEKEGEVPVGAVVVIDNQLIAQGWNQPIGLNDPTAHAEILALRTAGKKLNNYRLTAATLYVTLEPCMMCVGAIVQARIKRLVYGSEDKKTGAVSGAFSLLNHPQLNHQVEVLNGIYSDPCSQMLKTFFQKKRLQFK